VDVLREQTGIGFARAENLVECTQNADVFVEVSGILKAHAVSLLKISSDLRLASSGPDAGFGELHLPPRQVGSSIMPAKVNPVIPEAVSQVAMLVFGYDQTIAQACAAGNFELNPFLPLVAACLLESLDLLARADQILKDFCIDALTADESQCCRHVESATATTTALISALGHETACRVAQRARHEGAGVRQIVLAEKLLTAEAFDALIAPEAVCRLGSPDDGAGTRRVPATEEAGK
jgi:aspartate ammonia-lyase